MRYLTVAEIAHLYRRPVGTIYRLASTDRWRRCPGRPALYFADDVDTSMTPGSAVQTVTNVSERA